MLARCATPRVVTAVNGWFTVAWVPVVPLTLFTGLKGSVPFVAFMMLWQIIFGHLGNWIAGRGVEIVDEG